MSTAFMEIGRAPGTSMSLKIDPAGIGFNT